MPKVERLVQLASIMRSQPKMPVSELGQVCGVSERTIYRYLKTLAKMGPILGGDQTSFVAGTHHESTDYLNRSDQSNQAHRLDRSDRELLSFVLDNNPLSMYPFFAQRLEAILQKIEPSEDSDQSQAESSLLEVELSNEKVVRPYESRLLEKFTQAKTRSQKLRLSLTSGGDDTMVVTPVAVKIDSGGVALIVIGEETTERQIILLTEIRGLEVMVA